MSHFPRGFTAGAANRVRSNRSGGLGRALLRRDRGRPDRFSRALRIAEATELRLSFEKVKKKRFPLRRKTLYGAAAALPMAKDIIYLNQRLDRLSEPLEGWF
jgi:hypothetical protein